MNELNIYFQFFLILKQLITIYTYDKTLQSRNKEYITITIVSAV